MCTKERILAHWQQASNIQHLIKNKRILTYDKNPLTTMIISAMMDLYYCGAVVVIM